MKIISNIVTLDDAFYGEIEFDHVIQKITKLGSANSKESWLYPGFIDLHIHGGGGHDVMEGEAAIRKLLQTHLRHGTTSLLATTVTESKENLVGVFKAVKAIIDHPNKDEAHLLGVHLEGPFLSDKKLGAQPDLTRPFDFDEVVKLNQIAPIKVITLAPESGISHDDILKLKKLGIIIQLGHSNEAYEKCHELLNNGVDSVTHLFNAMSSMHHRAPGLVGATLAHATNAELIPDLLHVHPGAIKVALRAIPSLYFVTDATAASAMPDGVYQLGPHQVHKCANGVRLADGTLAGSSLTMDKALANISSLGLSPPECAKRLSNIQAKLLSLSDRGEIKVGLNADLCFFDHSQKIISVFKNGQKI